MASKHVITIEDALDRVKRLGRKCAGLKDASGKIIVAQNRADKPIEYEEIKNTLASLPPDNYIIYTSNAGKSVPVEFTVTNAINQNAFNMAENPKGVNPAEFGRLQSEVERYKAECERLEQIISDLTKELDTLQDEIELLEAAEPDPIAEPAPNPLFKLAEAAAPAVPPLIDSLIDFLKNKNKPAPADPAPHQQPTPIDYDLLAQAIFKSTPQNFEQ